MRCGIHAESQSADYAQVRHALGKGAYDFVAHQKAVLRDAARAHHRKRPARKRFGIALDIDDGRIVAAFPQERRVKLVGRGYGGNAVFACIFQLPLRIPQGIPAGDAAGYVGSQPGINELGFRCRENSLGAGKVVQQARRARRTKTADERESDAVKCFRFVHITNLMSPKRKAPQLPSSNSTTSSPAGFTPRTVPHTVLPSGRTKCERRPMRYIILP